MADPFIGEIRLMSVDHAPEDWAQCDGQLLPINQNQALFSLLGTTFGGNGQTTFALPDLRGRTPVHAGGFTVGQVGGEQSHTLSIAELPQHVHVANASPANGDVAVAAGNLLASVSGLHGGATSLTTLHPSSVTNVGGSQAHLNMQPFLALTFCIALQGIFPSPD